MGVVLSHSHNENSYNVVRKTAYLVAGTLRERRPALITHVSPPHLVGLDGKVHLKVFLECETHVFRYLSTGEQNMLWCGTVSRLLSAERSRCPGVNGEIMSTMSAGAKCGIHGRLTKESCNWFAMTPAAREAQWGWA